MSVVWSNNMQRRVGYGLSAGLVSLLFSVPSMGDALSGTRFDLHERVHNVDVRLERGHATLVVARTVENAAPKSDQAVFHIDVPEGGVATRLRTAGVNRRGELVWFEGELMEANAAAEKYTELTGVGGYYPKDPALLSWRSQRHLALQVFPVTGRGRKTVEYTVRMPMSYAEGAYTMTLPPLGTHALPAKVRVSAVHAKDTVEVNGVTVTAAMQITASRDLEVRLRPRISGSLEGALASFGFGNRRDLVHARVAAAPRLAQAPAHASVVVLIDTSRSMEERLTEELVAARSYLSHFPSADVEVLTFDRKVRSPFGAALPVKDAVVRLYTLTPSPANGSALDEAIRRADARLARSASAARRILVLTDLRTRESLTPERFGAGTLASGALLHMATVDYGEIGIARDDESPWAKLPRATGGLLWHATCSANLDDAARSVFEEWVRPKRISKLVVKGLSGFSAPEELREGEGLEHLATSSGPATQLSIEGELWSRRIRWSTSPSADEARRWAALVFGTAEIGALSEQEQMTLAMHGRAVSPVTSYLAIEPGVRPSTEGLERDELGSGGGALGGRAGSSCQTASFGGRGGRTIDRQAFLDAELARALAACGTSGQASVVVETTRIEIVDVRDVTLTPVRDTKVSTCIAEQLWNVMLPSAFDQEHTTWSVRARP